MKFTAVTLAVASLAATVVAENKYNHTNAGVHNKTSDCKIGSGKILGACADCAKTIVDCVHDGKNNKTCVKEIKGFAAGCGGCAVDLLECL